MVVDVQGEIEVGQHQFFPPFEFDQRRGLGDETVLVVVLVLGRRPSADDGLHDGEQGREPVEQREGPGSGHNQDGNGMARI